MPTPNTTPPLNEIEEYKRQLHSMDWSYAMSDDHRVWQSGEAKMARLRLQQSRFDPDASIWNSIAPEYAKVKK